MHYLSLISCYQMYLLEQIDSETIDQKLSLPTRLKYIFPFSGGKIYFYQSENYRFENYRFENLPVENIPVRKLLLPVYRSFRPIRINKSIFSSIESV